VPRRSYVIIIKIPCLVVAEARNLSVQLLDRVVNVVDIGGIDSFVSNLRDVMNFFNSFNMLLLLE
jgi:hypothetical protein